jgi:hypothetical protein
MVRSEITAVAGPVNATESDNAKIMARIFFIVPPNIIEIMVRN